MLYKRSHRWATRERPPAATKAQRRKQQQQSQQSQQNNPITNVFNDALLVNMDTRHNCHYHNTGGPERCAKIRKSNKQYPDMKGKDTPIVTCDDMITCVENLPETRSKILEPKGESGTLITTGEIEC